MRFWRGRVVATGVVIVAGLAVYAFFIAGVRPDVLNPIRDPSARADVSSPDPDRPTTQAGAASAPAPDRSSMPAADDGPVAERRTPTGVPRSTSARLVDVRDYGAKGDGVADDSLAIQRANDDVARDGGAGTVFFPPGVYRSSGIQQDSYVEFRGTSGSTVKHPDGMSKDPIVRSRVRVTTGSMTKGSRVIHLDGTEGMQKGAKVAVRGAGGASPTQWTALSVAISPFDQTLRVERGFGFSEGKTYRPNYLLVDGEVLSYVARSGSTFVELQRGLLGTRRASHGIGATVSQLEVLYAHVATVDHPARTATLDQPSRLTVDGAFVKVGVIAPTLRDITLDGSRRPNGSPSTNPFPVLYELVTGATIDQTTIRNGDDGAIRFDLGTERSVIQNSALVGNGSPTESIGAAIWLFRGAVRNVVRNTTISGLSYTGIYVDDRTIASTEFDEDSAQNTIVDNRIHLPRVGSNAAIGIIGSSDNVVRGNDLRGTAYGVQVYTGEQSGKRAPTSRNLIEDNRLAEHHFGFWVDGDRNRFIRNKLSDVDRPVVDNGADNEFS